MNERIQLLRLAADRAIDYLAGLDAKPAFPREDAKELRKAFSSTLEEEGLSAATVFEELVRAVDPALVAGAGGRYFGFVTGGALPAALAADWMTSVWDQNSFSYLSSPAASIVEDIVADWMKGLLRMPSDCSVAFVTGCQMGHVTCLAAARQHVLARRGWDVGAKGLYGAPPIRVIAGADRHVTVDRALRLLGFGTQALELVPSDSQGRMLPVDLSQRLAASDGPSIVIAQAGEVNTGAFDPLSAISDACEEHNDVWLHLDGAFGVWARVSDSRSHLVDGLERVDSVAFDAHKWLNVPYDSGVAVIAHPSSHRAAMFGSAAYLPESGTERDAIEWTPEASRRARSFAIYAGLRSLGRRGLRELVDRCCELAQLMGHGIAELPGAELVNEVELNQVLLRFESEDRTREILQRVQASGIAWMGGTQWRGQFAIRISVSSWVTTEKDVARTVAAFQAAL